MLTSELDYDLPEGLIATRPVEPRDACRLMVVRRSDQTRIEHRTFRDLPEYLRPGDVMVFNTSAVIPAKIQGRRRGTGAAVEGLFIRESAPTGADPSAAACWELMLKTGTRLAPGIEIDLDDAHGKPAGVRLRLVGRVDERWTAEVLDAETSARMGHPPGVILARVGATPLPPYIRKARQDRGDQTDDALDRAWYQCVYATSPSPPSAIGPPAGKDYVRQGGSERHAGSVAAPTAGLHFTPSLLERIAAVGVVRADVRLHVGIGTFKPVSAERLEDHPIHSERIEVPAEAVRAVERAHASGDRVFAVGTTSVRALESLPETSPEGPGGDVLRVGHADETSLFITPGFRFRHTDALITNFHHPRSTLLALVAALLGDSKDGSGGVERLLSLYSLAVREQYRFYSYGDAMLILP